jgi:predicted GH43/DUF377 family glycosyl hydrolase
VGQLVKLWPIVNRPPAHVILFVLLNGCTRYADFKLPPPDEAGPRAPFTWEASAAPVIARGGPGAWDSVDALNPSVVRFQGAYLNLYSGYDGRVWHTGVAQSSDGVAWRKIGRALSPENWEERIAANGSALVEGSEILYWYVGGGDPRIGLALSRDGGVTWSKESQPVVPLGPLGSFDERAVADPNVIRRGAFFYLFYLGQDRARRQRLGVARSRDGAVWEKLRSNPVLDLGPAGAFDEAGLGEPAVWSSGGAYWMLYTGRACIGNVSRPSRPSPAPSHGTAK